MLFALHQKPFHINIPEVQWELHLQAQGADILTTKVKGQKQ